MGHALLGNEPQEALDYSVHEAWNEATNVYLLVILVSFGLLIYAKKYVQKNNNKKRNKKTKQKKQNTRNARKKGQIPDLDLVRTRFIVEHSRRTRQTQRTQNKDTVWDIFFFFFSFSKSSFCFVVFSARKYDQQQQQQQQQNQTDSVQLSME
ncbi:small integral membrane protein 19 [Boleophthalmus pectinirostris]|uniref:small integral membrane protein 19 n=1 Tax=Boleophthalmus pectinirostris TaxID=150288 RepID=UPI00242B39EB|nr:small integral membrane protein 19 [Boleophthalmus pectinirostris]